MSQIKPTLHVSQNGVKLGIRRQDMGESKEDSPVQSADFVNAQEAERQRIASELHDGIGQSLTAIKFQLENYVRTCGQQPLAGDDRPLGRIVESIQDTITEVWRLSMALRPSTLDDLGILSTFDWFLREYQAAYPAIKVQRQIDLEEPDIPEALKLALYRIVQEALNNVAKHANATAVSFALKKSAEGITLQVEDGGQGFSTGNHMTPGASKGFGLKSMRERAELTGGSLQIESSQGSGTKVSARWPADLLANMDSRI